MTPTTRKTLYRLAAAVVAVVAVYVGVSVEEQEKWLALASSVIGVAGLVMSDRNTPKTTVYEVDERE